MKKKTWIMSIMVIALVSSVLGSILIFSSCEKNPYAKSQMNIAEYDVTIAMDAQTLYLARTGGEDINYPTKNVAVQLQKMPKGIEKFVTAKSENTNIATVENIRFDTDKKGNTQIPITARNGGNAVIRVMSSGGGMVAKINVSVVIPAKDFNVKKGKQFAAMKGAGIESTFDFDNGYFDFYSVNGNLSEYAGRSYTSTFNRLQFDLTDPADKNSFKITGNRLTIKPSAVENRSVGITATLLDENGNPVQYNGENIKRDFVVWLVEPMTEIELDATERAYPAGFDKYNPVLVTNHDANTTKKYASEIDYAVKIYNLGGVENELYGDSTYGYGIMTSTTSSRYLYTDRVDAESKTFHLSGHMAEKNIQPWVDIIVYPIIKRPANQGGDLHLKLAEHSHVQQVKRLNVLLYNVFTEDNPLYANGNDKPVQLFYNPNDNTKSVSFKINHQSTKLKYIANNETYFPTNANVYFELEYTDVVTPNQYTAWTKYPYAVTDAFAVTYDKMPLTRAMYDTTLANFTGMEYTGTYSMQLSDKGLLDRKNVRIVVRAVDQRAWPLSMQFPVGIIDLNLIRDIDGINVWADGNKTKDSGIYYRQGNEILGTKTLYPVITDAPEGAYDFWLEGIELQTIGVAVGVPGENECKTGYGYKFLNAQHESLFYPLTPVYDHGMAKFNLRVKEIAQINLLDNYQIKFTYATGKEVILTIKPLEIVKRITDMTPRLMGAGDGFIWNEASTFKSVAAGRLLSRAAVQIGGEYGFTIANSSSTFVWATMSVNGAPNQNTDLGALNGSKLFKPMTEGIYTLGFKFAAFNMAAINHDTTGGYADLTIEYLIEIVVIRPIYNAAFAAPVGGETELRKTRSAVIYSAWSLSAIKDGLNLERADIEIKLDYLNGTESIWKGEVSRTDNTENGFFAVARQNETMFRVLGINKTVGDMTIDFSVLQEIRYPNNYVDVEKRGQLICTAFSKSPQSAQPLRFTVTVKDAVHSNQITLAGVAAKNDSGGERLNVSMPNRNGGPEYDAANRFGTHELSPTLAPSTITDVRVGYRFDIENTDTNERYTASHGAGRHGNVTIGFDDVLHSGLPSNDEICVTRGDLGIAEFAERKIVSVDKRGVVKGYSGNEYGHDNFTNHVIHLVVYTLDSVRYDNYTFDGQKLVPQGDFKQPAENSRRSFVVKINDPDAPGKTITSLNEFIDLLYEAPTAPNYKVLKGRDFLEPQYDPSSGNIRAKHGRTGFEFALDVNLDLTQVKDVANLLFPNFQTNENVVLGPIKNLGATFVGNKFPTSINGKTVYPDHSIRNFGIDKDTVWNANGTDYFGMFQDLSGTVKGVKYDAVRINLENYVSAASASRVNLGVVAANIMDATPYVMPTVVDVNIDIRDGVYSGSAALNFGAVAGENGGTITENKCLYITGKMTIGKVGGAAFNIGGVAGENHGTIGKGLLASDKILEEDIVIVSNITLVVSGGVASVGGIAGENNATVQNVSSECVIVNADGGNTGGLVGRNTSNILKSYSNGVIYSAGNIGGLVGLNDGGLARIADCYYDFIASTSENSRLLKVIGTGSNADLDLLAYLKTINPLLDKTYAGITVISGNSGSNNVGGLVGKNNSGKIEYSFAASAFYDKDNALAPVAETFAGLSYKGDIYLLNGATVNGIAGNSVGGNIDVCYAGLFKFDGVSFTALVYGTVPTGDIWYKRNVTMPQNSAPNANDAITFQFDTANYPKYFGVENGNGRGITYVIPADNGSANALLFCTLAEYTIQSKYYLDEIFKTITMDKDLYFGHADTIGNGGQISVSIASLATVNPNDASTRVQFNIQNGGNFVKFGVELNGGKPRYYIAVTGVGAFDLVAHSARSVPGSVQYADVQGKVHFEVVNSIKQQSLGTSRYGEVANKTLSQKDSSRQHSQNFAVDKTAPFSIDPALDNKNLASLEWNILEKRTAVKTEDVDFMNLSNRIYDGRTTHSNQYFMNNEIGWEYIQFNFMPFIERGGLVYSANGLGIDIRAYFYKGAKELTIKQNKSKIDASSAAVFSGSITTSIENIFDTTRGITRAAKFLDLVQFDWGSGNKITEPQNLFTGDDLKGYDQFDPEAMRNTVAERVIDDPETNWRYVFTLRAWVNENGLWRDGDKHKLDDLGQVKWDYELTLAVQINPNSAIYEYGRNNANTKDIITNRAFTKILNGKLWAKEIMRTENIDAACTFKKFEQKIATADVQIVPQEVQTVRYAHHSVTTPVKNGTYDIYMNGDTQIENFVVYDDSDPTKGGSGGLLSVIIGPSFANIDKLSLQSDVKRIGQYNYTLGFKQYIKQDGVFGSYDEGQYFMAKEYNPYLPVSSVKNLFGAENQYSWEGVFYFYTYLERAGNVVHSDVWDEKYPTFNVNVTIESLDLAATEAHPNKEPQYTRKSNIWGNDNYSPNVARLQIGVAKNKGLYFNYDNTGATNGAQAIGSVRPFYYWKNADNVVPSVGGEFKMTVTMDGFGDEDFVSRLIIPNDAVLPKEEGKFDAHGYKLDLSITKLKTIMDTYNAAHLTAPMKLTDFVGKKVYVRIPYILEEGAQRTNYTSTMEVRIVLFKIDRVYLRDAQNGEALRISTLSAAQLVLKFDLVEQIIPNELYALTLSQSIAAATQALTDKINNDDGEAITWTGFNGIYMAQGDILNTNFDNNNGENGMYYKYATLDFQMGKQNGYKFIRATRNTQNFDAWITICLNYGYNAETGELWLGSGATELTPEHYPERSDTKFPVHILRTGGEPDPNIKAWRYTESSRMVDTGAKGPFEARSYWKTDGTPHIIDYNGEGYNDWKSTRKLERVEVNGVVQSDFSATRPITLTIRGDTNVILYYSVVPQTVEKTFQLKISSRIWTGNPATSDTAVPNQTPFTTPVTQGTVYKIDYNEYKVKQDGDNYYILSCVYINNVFKVYTEGVLDTLTINSNTHIILYYILDPTYTPDMVVYTVTRKVEGTGEILPNTGLEGDGKRERGGAAYIAYDNFLGVVGYKLKYVTVEWKDGEYNRTRKLENPGDVAINNTETGKFYLIANTTVTAYYELVPSGIKRWTVTKSFREIGTNDQVIGTETSEVDEGTSKYYLTNFNQAGWTLIRVDFNGENLLNKNTPIPTTPAGNDKIYVNYNLTSNLTIIAWYVKGSNANDYSTYSVKGVEKDNTNKTIYSWTSAYKLGGTEVLTFNDFNIYAGYALYEITVDGTPRVNAASPSYTFTIAKTSYEIIAYYNPANTGSSNTYKIESKVNNEESDKPITRVTQIKREGSLTVRFDSFANEYGFSLIKIGISGITDGIKQLDKMGDAYTINLANVNTTLTVTLYYIPNDGKDKYNRGDNELYPINIYGPGYGPDGEDDNGGLGGWGGSGGNGTGRDGWNWFGKPGYNPFGKGKYYVLMQDVHLYDYEPIVFEAAQLDGNNKRVFIHSFSDEWLRSLSGGSVNIGVFSNVAEGSVIKNLGIVIENRAPWSQAPNGTKILKLDLSVIPSSVSEVVIGALAGTNNGILNNVYVAGTDQFIRSDKTYIPQPRTFFDATGSTQSTVDVNHEFEYTEHLEDLSKINGNSYFDTEVESYHKADYTPAQFIVSVNNPNLNVTFGGLVGMNVGSELSGVISNSRVYVDIILNNLSVSGDSSVNISNVAGFAGENSGTIVSSFFKDATVNNQSYNNNDVSINSRTAGFVGINSSRGIIKACYVKNTYEVFNVGTANSPIWEGKDFGAISSRSTTVAGFVHVNRGSNSGGNQTQIYDCYVEVKMTISGANAQSRHGFLFNNEQGAIVENCFVNNRDIGGNAQNGGTGAGTAYWAFHRPSTGADAISSVTGIKNNKFLFHVSGQANDEPATGATAGSVWRGIRHWNVSIDKPVSDNMDTFKGFSLAPFDPQHEVQAEIPYDIYDVSNIWRMTQRGPRLVAADRITTSIRVYEPGKELTGQLMDCVDFTEHNRGKKFNPVVLYDADQFNMEIYELSGAKDADNVPSTLKHIYGVNQTIYTNNIRIASNMNFREIPPEHPIETYKSVFGRIGGERVVLDGNGLSMKNIMFNANPIVGNSDLDSVGFFSVLLRAVVKNLSMTFVANEQGQERWSINANNAIWVGGLAGKAADSELVDLEISGETGQGNWLGNIYGENITGGLVGETQRTRLENITVDISVQSSRGRERNIPPDSGSGEISASSDKEYFAWYSTNDTQSISGGVVGKVMDSKSIIIKNITNKASGKFMSGEVTGGIFGYVSAEANAKDLFVTQPITLRTKFHAGGIAGINYGTIDGAAVTATALTVGLHYPTGNSPITEWEVVGGDKKYFGIDAGGIAGINVGKIVKSTVQTRVDYNGIQNLGGIVGYNTDTMPTPIGYNLNNAETAQRGILSGCTVSGTTLNGGLYIGGLIGYDCLSVTPDIQGTGTFDLTWKNAPDAENPNNRATPYMSVYDHSIGYLYASAQLKLTIIERTTEYGLSPTYALEGRPDNIYANEYEFINRFDSSVGNTSPDRNTATVSISSSTINPVFFPRNLNNPPLTFPPFAPEAEKDKPTFANQYIGNIILSLASNSDTSQENYDFLTVSDAERTFGALHMIPTEYNLPGLYGQGDAKVMYKSNRTGDRVTTSMDLGTERTSALPKILKQSDDNGTGGGFAVRVNGEVTVTASSWEANSISLSTIIGRLQSEYNKVLQNRTSEWTFDTNQGSGQELWTNQTTFSAGGGQPLTGARALLGKFKHRLANGVNWIICKRDETTGEYTKKWWKADNTFGQGASTDAHADFIWVNYSADVTLKVPLGAVTNISQPTTGVFAGGVSWSVVTGADGYYVKIDGQWTQHNPSQTMSPSLGIQPGYFGGITPHQGSIFEIWAVSTNTNYVDGPHASYAWQAP